MVLAAGFGTRLRPLTGSLPKPLLPVANRPLLEYTFALLAAAGVGEVIVNAHHLADAVQEGLGLLDSSGLAIHLSRERRILGTAGGPKKAAPFLEGGRFIMMNGDFLVDLDLRRAVDFHAAAGAKATMVLRPDEAGEIFVDAEGRIRRFLGHGGEPSPRWRRCGFTGIHVLEPEVLSLIPANTPWEINRQVYPEMLRRDWPVFGLVHEGYWREAGDPPGYLAANFEVLDGRAGRNTVRAGAGRLGSESDGVVPPVLLGEGAVVEGATVGPRVVVGPGARIGPGAVVVDSVILAGAEVADGERLRGEVRGTGRHGAVGLTGL